MSRTNCSRCEKKLNGKHYSLCKTCAAKAALEWYYKHKDDPIRKKKRKEYQKEYYKRFPKEDWIRKGNKSRRNRRAKLRKEILEKLGNKCCLCSFDDKRILEIDHIYGGGNQEIKSFKNKNWNQYLAHVLKSIEKNEKKYRLLCPNCNRLTAWKVRNEKKEECNNGYL